MKFVSIFLLAMVAMVAATPVAEPVAEQVAVSSQRLAQTSFNGRSE